MFESRADMIDGHARIPITDWLRENATQIAELQAAGCAKICREKVSGARRASLAVRPSSTAINDRKRSSGSPLAKRRPI